MCFRQLQLCFGSKIAIATQPRSSQRFAATACQDGSHAASFHSTARPLSLALELTGGDWCSAREL
jgi:hypothetical protein